MLMGTVLFCTGAEVSGAGQRFRNKEQWLIGMQSNFVILLKYPIEIPANISTCYNCNVVGYGFVYSIRIGTINIFWWNNSNFEQEITINNNNCICDFQCQVSCDTDLNHNLLRKQIDVGKACSGSVSFDRRKRQEQPCICSETIDFETIHLKNGKCAKFDRLKTCQGTGPFWMMSSGRSFYVENVWNILK